MDGGTAMDLEGYLKRNKVWYKSIRKPETVHTADAAKVAGVNLHRVTKNLVCETDRGEHVMVIIPGDRQVDFEASGRALEVKNVRLVGFEEAEKISGYPPGGTPSIGHKNKMRVVVDRRLLAYETVYCGGGSRGRLLELKMSDVFGLNDAIVASVSV
jgi:Cys-tRNA(Pro)/Cys-tRNA(Cys) deacylase